MNKKITNTPVALILSQFDLASSSASLQTSDHDWLAADVLAFHNVSSTSMSENDHHGAASPTIVKITARTAMNTEVKWRITCLFAISICEEVGGSQGSSRRLESVSTWAKIAT